MHLTMQLKLLPTTEQAAAMLRTMERFNAACDALAAVAFANRCANKVELQKLAYHDIRRDFGLGAQMTVRAIAKVVEVYKRDKDIQPTFRPHGAIVYDQRILSWKGSDRVSILTNDGRMIMPWICGAYQHAQLDRVRGQADLIYRDGMFFLYVTIDVGDVPEGDPTEYLGVDLGQRTSRPITTARRSAARSMPACVAGMRGCAGNSRRKEPSPPSDCCVPSAQGVAVRQRSEPSHQQIDRAQGQGHRTRHRVGRPDAHSRPDNGEEEPAESAPRMGICPASEFRDLQGGAGWRVPLVCVDPRNTSRECPECGCIDKRNRPTRDRFACIRCAFSGPADTTAARNIAGRAERHAAERRAV
jgi:putative transposase